MTTLAIALAAVGLAVLGAGALSAASERRRTTLAAALRVDQPSRHGPPPTALEARLETPLTARVVEPFVQRLGELVATLGPEGRRAQIAAQLTEAGLDRRRRPIEVLAAEGLGALLGLVLGVAFVATGVVRPVLGVVVAVGLVAIGALGPAVWLRRAVEARREAIRADLPDVLDLLAISVEAGVGLEGAMAVVTRSIDAPIAEEIQRMLKEMELGSSRRDALVSLRSRTAVSELSSFVQALLQADELGMPVGRVLKVQAGEQRKRQRQVARERAAKLPVKILFPLVACIFPAVLVIVLGPAVSEIGRALG